MANNANKVKKVNKINKFKVVTTWNLWTTWLRWSIRSTLSTKLIIWSTTNNLVKIINLSSWLTNMVYILWLKYSRWS